MEYGEFVAMDGGEVNLTTAVDGGEVGINSEIDGSEIGVVMTVSENNYNNLSNKPSINGVTLVGDKTTADLLIDIGVTSVNGMDGDVVLDASDVGALPDDTFIPSKTSDINNDSGYITFNDIPPIPSKTSDLQNDSGYITSASVPTKVSELTNDSGYITSSALPTKVSDLQNDSGFISIETDPTVPSWAKASSKPSYTASEVGALPSNTTYVSSFNGSSGAITYTAPVTSVNGQTGAVSLSIPTVPTNVSSFNNDAGYLTLSTLPIWDGSVT
jgi:hypothetical protein